jgi:hypothetical protein
VWVAFRRFMVAAPQALRQGNCAWFASFPIWFDDISLQRMVVHCGSRQRRASAIASDCHMGPSCYVTALVIPANFSHLWLTIVQLILSDMGIIHFFVVLWGCSISGCRRTAPTSTRPCWRWFRWWPTWSWSSSGPTFPPTTSGSWTVSGAASPCCL